jgi:SAM-dependent methyltransferase
MGFLTLPRSMTAELMDDPALPADEHRKALRALARINGLSGTAWQLARGVSGIVRDARHSGRLDVVDLGCGGGDVTLALTRYLRRSGLDVRMTGVDASPRAIEEASQRARDARIEMTFLERDLVRDGCPPCDVAVSSLFFHHLDDVPACGLLGSVTSAARLGAVISDLVRSRLGLVLAKLGTSLLVRSRVARIDGPLSVRAARTRDEYRRLAEQAGMRTAAVRAAWPARAMITWSRAGERG